MNSPLNEIFKVLHTSQKASQIALDQIGRVPYPVLAVVTNNVDPTDRRRIQVSDPAKPDLSSDWLRRINPFPFIDPPLPTVGQTVLCLFIGGDELKGWYLSLNNDTNPPHNKLNPIEDLSLRVPKNLTVHFGETAKVTCDSGVEIFIDVAGRITIKASELAIDAPTVAFNNASSVSINGKQILTIGSVDTRGDTNTTRGW
ncbi:hypothetical protein H6F88_31750 [Oculatella sp. FACHB-28]|uniref:hypothetical protein n=1 Tax=Oculatella sp. FACHB-28 TaxID=2692845 RepID=UPI00198EC6BF|nr:hypothetical protein [Oculatella sp. FACHB-28]MBD2060518.1 hypothetical protein [Oculatella sp. FACHB-28]